MSNPLPVSLPGGVTAGSGGFGGIKYNLPGLMDAVQQIHDAAVATDQNHTDSVNCLNASPESFQGHGHETYAQCHTLINQAYNLSQDAIAQAGLALNVASDGMRETDMQLASQYMNAGGMYT